MARLILSIIAASFFSATVASAQSYEVPKMNYTGLWRLCKDEANPDNCRNMVERMSLASPAYDKAAKTLNGVVKASDELKAANDEFKAQYPNLWDRRYSK
ncbi:MAG: hypothetical protein WCK46_01000 [Candidatus Adlerbacteria bacterium]